MPRKNGETDGGSDPGHVFGADRSGIDGLARPAGCCLEEAGDDILLYPAVGKLVGSYPASYRNERGEEEKHDPMEDEQAGIP